MTLALPQPPDGNRSSRQTLGVVDLRSPDGFRVVYRAELPYVWATVQRLGGRPPHIEDLCHDVFMAAFRKRHDFDTSRPLRPWLFGIAFRLMLNARRKQSTPPADDEHQLDAMIDPTASPEQTATRTQQRAALLKALEVLEPDRRAVFLLHDLEGQPAPEIARTLEIPLNTVYSRLRLARADVMRATEAFRQGGMP